jgi:hypothetical protein
MSTQLKSVRATQRLTSFFQRSKGQFLLALPLPG